GHYAWVLQRPLVGGPVLGEIGCRRLEHRGMVSQPVVVPSDVVHEPLDLGYRVLERLLRTGPHVVEHFAGLWERSEELAPDYLCGTKVRRADRHEVVPLSVRPLPLQLLKGREELDHL